MDAEAPARVVAEEFAARESCFRGAAAEAFDTSAAARSRKHQEPTPARQNIFGEQ